MYYVFDIVTVAMSKLIGSFFVWGGFGNFIPFLPPASNVPFLFSGGEHGDMLNLRGLAHSLLNRRHIHMEVSISIRH